MVKKCMDNGNVLQLKCPVQPYPWGKKGSVSLVNRFAGVCADTPGAELWFGAHPKAPSEITINGLSVPLTVLLREKGKEILGERIWSKFGGTLPFLFKILSIGSALSIQAHPDKELAIKLHKQDPINYPDSNHKPEIAIAISELTLLCGFRPIAEIKRWFSEISELGEFLSEKGNTGFFERSNGEAILKEVFLSVMNADREFLKRQTDFLRSKLQARQGESLEAKWFVELSQKYSEGDPGVFCLFLLNLVRVAPGLGVYTGAGIPHAYLNGDIAECMANSDNVVRAGLTEKYIDRKTLGEMLVYAPCVPELSPPLVIDGVGTYSSPAEEFVVDVFQKGQFDCNTHKDAHILFSAGGVGKLCVSGEAVALMPGTALIVPAFQEKYRLELDNGPLFRVRVP